VERGDQRLELPTDLRHLDDDGAAAHRGDRVRGPHLHGLARFEQALGHTEPELARLEADDGAPRLLGDREDRELADRDQSLA
jgi:hypothetical protein